MIIKLTYALIKAGIKICLILNSLSVACQINTFEIHPLFNSQKGTNEVCYRIPALITLQNGTIICAADQRIQHCGDLRSNNDINIVIRKSYDSGITWEDLQVIVDYPVGESASDPSFIYDKVTDRLFLFFNYMDLKKQKGIYHFKYILSTDYGESWSQPVDITNSVTTSEWEGDFKFITSGKGIQLSNGTLLHTMVNLDKGLHIFGSSDHGNNWYLIHTPVMPADESKILELDDGTWMVNSRVPQAGYRYIHHSSDKGKSWTSRIDSNLMDPSCNASLIKLPANLDPAGITLIFSNAKSKSKRENLSLSISYDEGQSWPKSITIYEGSSAYSSLSLLKDGNIGLVFEKDDYMEIGFVKIPLQFIF